MAAANCFHLTTLWQFDAPLAAVWDAIVEPETWPGWWPGVEQVVTLERGHEEGGLGTRQRFVWKGILPYRLSFVSRVTRLEPLHLLEGRVEGQLEGVGRWRFNEDAGQTRVCFDWRVRTTPAWMNLLAPLAQPLFRWNHRLLMHAGGVGLARRLGTRLAFQTTWSS
ncbi:SRPBCC family protein [Azorhizophilus paspali]|uniref:SRPBCC family protein n=2 Tax=Azorhizophilus paspali TaxID=69963 RepID=A0ABV6SI38_AZOPA